MKNHFILVIAAIFLFMLSGCNVQENVNALQQSEGSTIQKDIEDKYIEIYNSSNKKSVATVDGEDVEVYLVEAIKNQQGVDISNTLEYTVELVAINECVKKNNIIVDQSEYATFYDSNLEIANSISSGSLEKMGISREEFLEELNYLMEIIASKSSLNRYVFQKVIDGNWKIEDETLNKQYLKCVDKQKKFDEQKISYGEFYDDYQKFFDNYCEYILEQCIVIYY